jgi:hypothetical protein
MPDEGFDPAECLDFDFSVVDFHSWVEARQDERKPVRESARDQLPNRGKGWTWGPRYERMSDIFDIYTGKWQDMNALDPDVEAIDIDEMLTSWASETRGQAWAE